MFDAFSINEVPRDENMLVDDLSVIACTFEILEYLRETKCKVEVLFRPFVPDNQDHWKVFDNDAQIVHFLHCIDYLQNNVITLHDKM